MSQGLKRDNRCESEKEVVITYSTSFCCVPILEGSLVSRTNMGPALQRYN